MLVAAQDAYARRETTIAPQDVIRGAPTRPCSGARPPGGQGRPRPSHPRTVCDHRVEGRGAGGPARRSGEARASSSCPALIRRTRGRMLVPELRFVWTPPPANDPDQGERRGRGRRTGGRWGSSWGERMTKALSASAWVRYARRSTWPPTSRRPPPASVPTVKQHLAAHPRCSATGSSSARSVAVVKSVRAAVRGAEARRRPSGRDAGPDARAEARKLLEYMRGTGTLRLEAVSPLHVGALHR